MKNHERICLRRSESRACYTCGNIEWVTDRNAEHVAVPVCKLGLLKPDPENKRNPRGFVRNCEQWEAKYPGEAE